MGAWRARRRARVAPEARRHGAGHDEASSGIHAHLRSGTGSNNRAELTGTQIVQ